MSPTHTLSLATLITELVGLVALITFAITVVRILWVMSAKWTRVLFTLERQSQDLIEIRGAKEKEHTIIHERINRANDRTERHEKFHMDTGRTGPPHAV